jgi:hypothetical protein
VTSVLICVRVSFITVVPAVRTRDLSGSAHTLQPTLRTGLNTSDTTFHMKQNTTPPAVRSLQELLLQTHAAWGQQRTRAYV